jgi:RNA polymerase sigma-70 factor (ECF subfamily)
MSPLDEEKPGDLKEALKQCIEKLKREQKECIVLFYYNEKCYQEISDKLKLPLGKVKSFIQNGKRNLKICLKKQNETE